MLKGRALILAFGISGALAVSCCAPVAAQSLWDAQGVYHGPSTAAERAQTAALNAGMAGSNYAQPYSYANRYQQELERYRWELRRYHLAQRDYRDATADYHHWRSRYTRERAHYGRTQWSPNYDYRAVSEAPRMGGQRIGILEGEDVGTIVDAAHASNGNIEAVLVQLDNGKVVWIDAEDVRYVRQDGLIYTDLNRAALSHMPDERG